MHTCACTNECAHVCVCTLCVCVCVCACVCVCVYVCVCMHSRMLPGLYTLTSEYFQNLPMECSEQGVSVQERCGGMCEMWKVSNRHHSELILELN